MIVDIIRIITDRDTNEERTVVESIDKNELSCIYKDKYGVFLSLTNGKMIKAENVTMDQMKRAFNL